MSSKKNVKAHLISSELLPLNGKADFFNDDTIRVTFTMSPREDVCNLVCRKRELEELFKEVLGIYSLEHAEWDDAIHDNWMVRQCNLYDYEDYEEGGEL